MISELPEHQSKQVIPAGEMFHVFVTTIFGYNAIELTPIEERNQLSENVFILEHLLSD